MFRAVFPQQSKNAKRCPLSLSKGVFSTVGIRGRGNGKRGGVGGLVPRPLRKIVENS